MFDAICAADGLLISICRHLLQFSSVPFYFIDVNSVPYALVKEYGVSKMPTVQILRRGQPIWTYLW